MPGSRCGSSRAASLRDRSVSPARYHRRVPTINDFPVPGDYQHWAVKVRDQGLVSPSGSSFSFVDNDLSPIHYISAPPSPTLSLSHAVSTPRNDLEKEMVLQAFTRGAPGDVLPLSTPARTPHERDLARKRSRYYQEVFASREPTLTPKDRIDKNSVITVEVKTNVKVRIALTLCSDFYLHLAFPLDQRGIALP